MDFWEVVESAINQAGGCKQLAGTIGIDQSTISRFRNGETGLTIPKLDKIINAAGYVIVPAAHNQDQELAICALSRILERKSKNNIPRL